ncbi:MAG TPA: anaerobic ribonucleoside-triphosphate reductase activating protein [Humidesulfovibrio sp.]|uniref:anaerobic ribonucleoside-triphosphate reductase activating protein n=1 Tax=Humidesulfovibrio sp. TaxID=2910988 RepID=UPI002CA70F44|nr:anaerobic ribonucleoside-triphosphate reductase activating protein [Humidesulfovibrio sp.]HWR04640.1 anaerobic ribonucleoside-triphosphate reductase activating protein [Humidesulfovibrio sp.]
MNPEIAWNHLRGLTPLSLCDWPGHPCCVVFLGGCNLRCPTCHNAELAWDMERQPRIDQAALRAFLAKRARWLSGITVTGGEPTAVPGVGVILHELAASGLPIKLDTNGMLPEAVELMLAEGLVSRFAVDVKGPYVKYPALTGGAVDETAARRNLSKIFALAEERPEAFFFRTTLVPQLDPTDVETVRGMLPAGFTLTTQDYKKPRRPHALADSEARRTAGNLVD